MRVGKGGLLVPKKWVTVESGRMYHQGQWIPEGEVVVDCDPAIAKAIGFKKEAKERETPK